MVTLKQLKKIQTIEDLEALNIGRVVCNISYRGGGVGFHCNDVANHINVFGDFLPYTFGAGCNYLGGGVRGSIFPSGFNTEFITGRKAKLLRALGEACVRVYENIENEANLNDELDEDGDTNWDAMATNAARKEGIRSAY